MASDTLSSKQYNWNDISINWRGRILEGVTEVEIEFDREKSILRGRGDKGHGILYGNQDVKGKIKIWQSELETMIALAPDGDITKEEFDIVWAYAPGPGKTAIVDIISTASISNYKKSMKQGDKNMEVELPFIALDFKPQS
jgi:hypothetical protein